MHVEYWVCDECNEPIDYNEKTKYTTPEMGLPFIPRNGGGKHYHYSCLIKMYNRKRNLTNQEKAELIADAERRHLQRLNNEVLKKGNLSKEKLNRKKSTKKDRETLINYFYDYYGTRQVTKKLNLLIDNLDLGKDFGTVKNVKIPYAQLKEMLLYYRKDLDGLYFAMKKKGKVVTPLDRIYIDIKKMIDNYGDYLNRPEILYNQVLHNQVDGGEKIFDNSLYLKNVKKPDNSAKYQMVEDIDEFLNSLEEEDEDNEIFKEENNNEIK